MPVSGDPTQNYPPPPPPPAGSMPNGAHRQYGPQDRANFLAHQQYRQANPGTMVSYSDFLRSLAATGAPPPPGTGGPPPPGGGQPPLGPTVENPQGPPATPTVETGPPVQTQPPPPPAPPPPTGPVNRQGQPRPQGWYPGYWRDRRAQAATGAPPPAGFKSAGGQRPVPQGQRPPASPAPQGGGANAQTTGAYGPPPPPQKPPQGPQTANFGNMPAAPFAQPQPWKYGQGWG